jgi:sulfite reductase (NADPH) hemoprotein beta-component
VIEKIVSTFTDYRESDESFVQTLNRIGLEPFKERVYQREPSEATL